MTQIELYARLLQLGMTAAGAAGCVANIMAESAGRSDNLQDTYNYQLGVSDAEYVRQVDAGTRDFLATNSGGFGFCQWTSRDRRKALYDYLKGHGKSIADPDGQLQFMAREMRESYAYCWSILTRTGDPYEAGYVMCRYYEIPADTERQAQIRGNHARQLYQKYSGTAPATEPTEPAEPVKDSFWPPRMIDKGMSGSDVTVLQALLVARGYTLTAVNGLFENSTDKAVRQFQHDQALAVDGVVGNNTWGAILRR